VHATLVRLFFIVVYNNWSPDNGASMLLSSTSKNTRINISIVQISLWGKLKRTDMLHSQIWRFKRWQHRQDRKWDPSGKTKKIFHYIFKKLTIIWRSLMIILMIAENVNINNINIFLKLNLSYNYDKKYYSKKNIKYHIYQLL